MPHSFGRRARTRSMFAKPFRKSGEPSLSKYLTTYRVGDIVDIKCDGSIQRGMPYRYYHGRTGVIFNVTQRAVGVELMKAVKHRLIRKRICVRVEHISPSRSREDFLRRVKDNEVIKKEARAKGIVVVAKRLPRGPKAGFIVAVDEDNTPETMRPIPFDYTI